MNTPAESQNASYEQTLSTSAALFLDLMNTALAARERAALAKDRSASREPKLGDRIRELLRRRGPLTPREMRAIVGCSSMTLTRALRVLVAAGHVESRGNTRNVTYHLRRQSELLPCENPPACRTMPDKDEKGTCYDAANISTSKQLNAEEPLRCCGGEVTEDQINKTKDTT